MQLLKFSLVVNWDSVSRGKEFENELGMVISTVGLDGCWWGIRLLEKDKKAKND